MKSKKEKSLISRLWALFNSLPALIFSVLVIFFAGIASVFCPIGAIVYILLENIRRQGQIKAV